MIRIDAEPALVEALRAALARVDEPYLVAGDGPADAAPIIARARDFAAQTAGPACIVMVLRGATRPDWSEVDAATQVWAFVQWAALAWAPRRIRVNAVVLGHPPTSPFQARETAARAGFAAAAPPATPADIAAAVRLILSLPSMTGQMIRLGA